ncbi:hypothetical protein [Agromyces sp. Marseille-P2726]|uniref:hypothetical protein n=1 Tax=Agromyces sp. Marseille-P2726 TaxID=2709132 RepID=UPI00156FB3B1|nr:hypothetical protein [Agromyces sp. Marseille-P2726]
MSEQFGPRRPLGVTIVAALAFISGAFDIIGGLLLLPLQGDAAVADRFGGAAMVVTMAVISTLVGILTLVVAFGLLGGNPVARIAATILQALSLAMSIWVGITQPTTLATEIPSALLAVAIVILLWTSDATRYFRGLAPDEPTS